MSEDVSREDTMIDAVGAFYSTVYDDTMRWLERDMNKLPDHFEGSEQKLDFMRMIVHFTLCFVADQLKMNEEQTNGISDAPNVRYYVYNNGEELKEVDDEISPVFGWLSDVVPGEGLLGMFAKSALPSASVFNLSK